MDDNVFVQEDGRDEDEDPGQAVDDVEDILLDHVGGQEGKKEAWCLCVKSVSVDEKNLGRGRWRE